MKRFKKFIFQLKVKFDQSYLRFDKKKILRAKNIQRIPDLSVRQGGKESYGEWCHVIGIFQTLFYLHLSKKTGNRILDVGCGQGILAIASESFIQEGGRYWGIDVDPKRIQFCSAYYPKDSYTFLHLDVKNGRYAPGQQAEEKKKWAIEDESLDAVTALSVWTHLVEEDALFYFQEINRVLKPGGIAIVSFFILDHSYEKSLAERRDDLGKYHQQKQDLWIFDQKCKGSRHWFYPKWVKCEEDAIAITSSGIEEMIQKTNLKIESSYEGNWKEVPGVFFQDILVFKKNT